MKTKIIFASFIVVAIAVVCIVVFFISRPRHEELLPQKFAKLPETPKLIVEFHHGPQIRSVAFSPTDNSLIAFSDVNGTVMLWNRNIINKPTSVLIHPGLYASIDFSPNGKLLASVSSGKLVLWDVASETKLNSLETSNRQFAFSPDGQQLATVYNVVKLWDIRNPKQIKEIDTLPYDEAHKAKGWASAVEISSDGKWIATGYSHGTINVWNLNTKQHAKTLKTSFYEMNLLSFSPDNKFLVAGGSVFYMDDNKKKWISNGPKGYIMWELPSWKRHGTVQRGNIDNLVFHPNVKVCVSGSDISSTELWSVANGAPITSIPTSARGVSFSQDGSLLAIGGWDGVVQLWKPTPQQLELDTISDDVVQIIYLLPEDKEPSSNITEKIDKTIRKVQDFYADEMERHGFGRKTFSFETDENGKAKIYLIKENQSYNVDRTNDIWLTIQELNFRMPYTSYFDRDDTFRYTSNDGYTTRNSVWRDKIEGILPGTKISAYVYSLDHQSVAYALRGAFDVPYIHTPNKRQNSLKRFFSKVNDKMPWGKKWAKLSKCDTEWLSKSRYFNQNQSFFDKSPMMDMRVLVPKESDLRHFIFHVSDEDGVHQVQLFLPDTDISWPEFRFHDCQSVNGKEKADIVFKITDHEIMKAKLRMIDMLGNIASREFRIEKTSEPDKKQ